MIARTSERTCGGFEFCKKKNRETIVSDSSFFLLVCGRRLFSTFPLHRSPPSLSNSKRSKIQITHRRLVGGLDDDDAGDALGRAGGQAGLL